MKNLYIIFILLLSGGVFGQIEQNVNKTGGTTETNPISDIDSIRFNGSFTDMEIILNDGSMESHTISDIDDVSFSVPIPGEIMFLQCSGATLNGDLVDGVAATGVTLDVPYTGGNGGFYNGEVVNSTGVTGLTAELTSGNFTLSNGNVTYEITGTPNSVGTASFSLEVAGKTCTVELTVVTGALSSLDCGNSTLNGDLVDGVAATGVDVEIDYSGGNGGPHNGQTVNSTGVTGLTAELNAGNFSSGNGTLSYEITGTPNSDGTAIFAIEIGGETCTLELTVKTGEITSLDCAGASVNGTLVDGVAASGVSADIDYTGGNEGPHNGQSVSSTGVTGLVADLNTGSFASGNGTLNYEITGTPDSDGTASFAINIGGETCTLEITVETGMVASLDCAGATINGFLFDGIPLASGVSAEIAYTGGNEGPHNGQTVNSTGVTGLTAELTAGIFANGAGTLVYTISGTPNSDGVASFAIDIGGETCNLEVTVDEDPYPSGTVHCGNPTSIAEVTSTTGEVWMDRNLGADQVATSSTDQDAYGDLYQWGRFSDGHQCRTSSTTTTLSATDQPGHDDFIIVGANPNDWRDPQNNSLWQGATGTNNPCPTGFRLPTTAEIDSERASWSGSGASAAFNAPLKFTVGGYRENNTGDLLSVGSTGRYWGSTVNGANIEYLNLGATSNNVLGNVRALGHSVRCIKD